MKQGPFESDEPIPTKMLAKRNAQSEKELIVRR